MYRIIKTQSEKVEGRSHENVRLVSVLHDVRSVNVLGIVCTGDEKVVNGRQYTLVRGSFSQRDAWREAERRRGYPVVFETLREHTLVVNAFGLGRREADIAWTGHYQTPGGGEAIWGWTTYGYRASAPIHLLFNGNGPDDGITRTSPGGKNEDGGVIWKDNNGLLEDVSENQRANVLIEY